MKDLADLRPYRPRTFVPGDADLTAPDVVAGLFRRLLDRTVGSADELERWLLDRFELDDAFRQQESVLSIRADQQTDDDLRAKAYRAFDDNVTPIAKEMADRLDRKYLPMREAYATDARRYEVHDRNTLADVELFAADNIPLQTAESKLDQEYTQINGAMTVTFQGAERTLTEMYAFFDHPDRVVRESAWCAVSDRRGQDAERIDGIFEKMMPLRGQIAANAGCNGYGEYMFRHYHRFDYTPADCEAFHDAVERTVVPLLRKIRHRRRQRMGLRALRPWDLYADVEGGDPLRPFRSVDELVAGVTEVFARVDPEFARQFAGLNERGLLDLDCRKGKAQGGYHCYLNESRAGFIFMSVVGTDDDLRIVLHESGHAFHGLATAEDPFGPYRWVSPEISELASMSMELLAGAHLDVFYDDEQLARSRREHLEAIVGLLPMVAWIDAYQHWLYAGPPPTARQREEQWVAVRDRFSDGVVDWTGLERERARSWQTCLHLFDCPFYFIEYGIAQLGALQLWLRARQDPAGAIADYRKALALGGSRPLPELFETAGLQFDFSERTLAPLMDVIAAEVF